MKNLGRALLLLTLGVALMAPAAMAQDALSMILPSPYSSRVGSQIIYFYEDGGGKVAFLTVTNTNLSLSVTVHFQFYQIQSNGACQEIFDFTSDLSPNKTTMITPSAVKKDTYNPLTLTTTSIPIGTATNGRYLLTLTPVEKELAPGDQTARAFNYLTGQQWTSDTVLGSTWMNNALSRMAVETSGRPAPDPVPDLSLDGSLKTPVWGGAVTGFVTNDIHFQYYRPQFLFVNAYFQPNTIHVGGVIGNRLTFFAWADSYVNANVRYGIVAASFTLNSLAFDDNENAISIPQRSPSCVTEYNIGAANSSDFVNAQANAAITAKPGFIRMRVGAPSSIFTSLIGWFSQTYLTYGGGDYLIGVGRFTDSRAPITVNVVGGVAVQSTTGTVY